MIDRVTFTARLQVKRRGTFVAELGPGWVAVVAEGAHPVAKICGARGECPVRGAGRAHAGILSCFASDLMNVHLADPMFSEL